MDIRLGSVGTGDGVRQASYAHATLGRSSFGEHAEPGGVDLSAKRRCAELFVSEAKVGSEADILQFRNQPV